MNTSTRISSLAKFKKIIISLYEDGMSTRVIVKYLESKHSLSISHVTINKRLSRWGVDRRNGGNRSGKLARDLTGMKFGLLTVINRMDNMYPTTWLCKCDCGNEVVLEAKLLIYNRNPTWQCGCRKRKRRKSNGE